MLSKGKPPFCTLLWLLYVIILSINWIDGLHSERFYEELLVRPLPDGKVLTHFQFTTQWNRQVNVTPFEYSNSQLFPKSLGQIVDKFEVQELHLSFTQGRWWPTQWGYPIVSAPVGVELATVFKEKNQMNSYDEVNERINGQWKGLTYTLAGLFCASLEQMKSTVTSQPHFSFPSDFHYNNNNNNKNNNNNNSTIDEQPTNPIYLRYSTLAREAVCTENLTPWTKMLPCRQKVRERILFKKNYS
ncbi:hypothetical protein HMI54_011411 [Coelomomyces lativittatus]|nr:hypothetical protein HMI54_011411 [Coelomomyces lativittatus]